MLTHSSAADVPEAQLVLFLKKKGLTEDEIAEAQRRASAPHARPKATTPFTAVRCDATTALMEMVQAQRPTL